MKWKLQEKEVHYPILLFVVTLGISITRGVQTTVLAAVGRNGVWIFFPCMLAVVFGTWISLKIVTRMKSTSIMLAGGEIGPKLLAPASYFLHGLLFLGGAGYTLMLIGDFFSRTLLYGDQRLLMSIGPIIAGLMALFPMETIGRYAHLLMLFIVPPFLLLSLLPLSNAKWSYMLPIVDKSDWTDPLTAVAVIMLMFIPAAASTMLITRSAQKPSFVSLAVLMTGASFIAGLMLAMGITTLGLPAGKTVSFLANGTYSTVRLENFFLERVVFLIVLLWEYLT
ncbi:hypothetical protein N0M98_27940 [Paenibacillus doosanensis]|uniref:hypothetical protein n=1 Tax=Paenibacillus doosanensis TaxID=1229154 RepID=UPI0021807C7B|nr:hypothetical protein [Paenibacillus doosanensis]MCS7463945.1 hypothetical protein [Paenibacillus doosanensis]